MKLSAKQWMMGIVATVALANVVWAGDVWKEKKPADWSQKDMEKFLTRSPWARTVQPASTPPSMDQGPAGANTGGWGGGAPGGGGGGGAWRGGDMSGGVGAAMPIMTFHVRWVSAPIMREALKVAESESDLLNSAIENYAKDYYVISVSMQIEGGASGGGNTRGGPRGGGNWGGGQWGAPSAGQGASREQEEGRKRFEAALVQGATLRFKGKAVHPAKAEMKPSKAGMTTLYMFPRELKLEEVDKDYVFELTQGQIVTRANFNLKGFEQAQEKGL